MIGKELGKIGVDLERFVLVAGARQIAAIGLHGAQRLGIGLIRAGEALTGALLVVSESKDQSSMEILEDTVPFRAGQLVQRLDRGAAVAGSSLRPGRQQSR